MNTERHEYMLKKILSYIYTCLKYLLYCDQLGIARSPRKIRNTVHISLVPGINISCISSYDIHIADLSSNLSSTTLTNTCIYLNLSFISLFYRHYTY